MSLKVLSMSRFPSPPSNPPARPTAASPKRPAPAKAVPRLLSTTQAADYLGVSANTIRKYRDQGKIPAFLVGERLVKYDPKDLDRFMREFGE